MLNGDISNYTENVIAFRVDDFLCKKKSGRCFLPPSFVLEKDVDTAVKTVYFKTPYVIDLVCAESWGEKIIPFLEKMDIPYREIHFIKQEAEVRTLLTVNAFSYYIDNIELERIQVIRKTDYVMSLKELYQMITRRV